MKKNLIALAVATAFAAPAAMADAPVVYGHLNVNVNTQTDAGNGVDDTASRMGVKGSEDLGNGLKAVYQIEFGLDLEESNTSVTSRNQYLGLAGGFGTVLLGRHDTPLKMAQPTDLFNDGAADNNTAGVFYGLGVLGQAGENRVDEVLAYVSPTFSGVKIIAALSSEQNEVTAGSAALNADRADSRSLAGTQSVAAIYGSTKKGLFLSAAFEQVNYDVTLGSDVAEAADIDGDAYTHTSFAAQYKTGGLTVNGMVRTFDTGIDGDDISAGTATFIGAAYKMGKMTVKGKLIQAESDVSGSDVGTQTAIGLSYALGKKTTAYVYTTTRDAAYQNGGDKDAGDSWTGNYVGMVHKF